MITIGLACSFAYQLICEGADQRRFLGVGDMVAVGDRRIHIVRSAMDLGGPTAIIEAGSGDDSLSWRGVVAGISKFAPTLAYDRSGLGWSDPARSHRSIVDRAEELLEVITRSKVPGPFILIGHSYGGYIVRALAHKASLPIIGLVLVDASEEGYLFSQQGRSETSDVGARAYRLGWLARFGILRAIKRLTGKIPGETKAPAEQREERTAIDLKGSPYFEIADEMNSCEELELKLAEIGDPGSFKNMPIAIVTRSPHNPITGSATPTNWLSGQKRFLKLSNNAKMFVAERSGHNIQLDEPQAIVDAVCWVLEQRASASYR
jgi:pimeloyl-ACP methyl ester carboxylesterase